MTHSRIPADTTEPSLLAQRKSLFWRIHFWAALIASPFALVAALTGMLYVFTPQIEAVLYSRLDQVESLGTMRPLDESVAAAKAAAPAGWQLDSVMPPYGPRDTVKATFVPPAMPGQAQGGHHHTAVTTTATATASSMSPPAFGPPAQATVVSVDPYTARVMGSLPAQDRFNAWAKKLHSRLLQGENWRWMIELAASWMMVMLVTGVYLWWPRTGQKALPQAGSRGRVAWKQWHAFAGVLLGVLSLIILTTGLTWSKYAGGQIRAARDAIGQAPPPVPRNLHSMLRVGVAPLSWQAAWDAVRKQAPDVAVQLTPPRAPSDVWRASAADRGRPARRFDLQLDAYSGQTLFYAGWERQTAFGKATGIGIPFHRGEFGWWNQGLLLMFGAGVLFSLVSGWAMYFKRRQPGSLGLPRLLPGAWKSPSVPAWLTAAVMCATMPLLALSALLVVALEVALGRMHRPAHMI